MNEHQAADNTGTTTAATTATNKLAARSKSRSKLIFRRWLEVLGYGVLGAGIVVPILYWRHDEMLAVIDAPLEIWILGLICSIVLIARLKVFTGSRHLLSHPPLWVGSLFGTGIFLLFFDFTRTLRDGLPLWDELGESPLLVAIAFIVIVPVLVAVWPFLFRNSSAAKLPAMTFQETRAPLTFTSFETLCKWLANDEPITGTSDDRFGHSRIARRIAERLLESDPPAQAVLGRLGAGKTTLRRLVEDALKSTKTLRIVSVELWPYETSRAAVEGIIGAIVDAMAEEVCVLSLRGLSSLYAEAMSAAGDWGSTLVRVQGIPSKPIESLKAIDKIATAIGVRYVVWIEDLERFAGIEESQASEDKLNPIRALLYGLNQLDYVTVVTATTTLRMSFDIEKIARYVEELPKLHAAEVGKVLALFRKGCCEEGNIIDPATPGAREVFKNLGNEEDMRLRTMFSIPGVNHINDALVALSNTPRTLKQALRACFDSWRRLAGEIDLDDMLILCIIRESQPRAFAALRDHLYQFRGKALTSEARQKSKGAWNESLNRLSLDEQTREAILYCVDFIFSSERTSSAPQSVWHSHPVDYWERFLSIPTLSESERDQPVLHKILDNDDGALIDLIQDHSRSDAVEHFQSLLQPDRLVRLLVPLVERRSHESASSWSEQQPPGLIPLWRMWLQCSRAGNLPSPTVLREVRKALDIAVPQNLALATEIERYFVTSSKEIHPLVSTKERAEAKDHLRKLLVLIYKDQGEKLARNLKGTRIYTLYWLTWGARTKETTGMPFVNWSDFVDTILEAAQLNPSVMLPQIAPLVIRAHDSMVIERGAEQRYEFDEEAAKSLFGDVTVIADLFAAQNVSDWNREPRVQAIISGLAGEVTGRWF